MVKNCIFHIPYSIDPNGKSGTHIRPVQMLMAFKKIGYNVDCVMGYGKERKKQISQIKRKIDEGKVYDFLYSESNTMPTLLTEKHHIPTYPFLDFDFFRYLKKRGVKIGLFYRDIHWKFDIYKQLYWYKRAIGIYFYKYDLRQYNKLVDVLFLPTKSMMQYLPEIKSSISVVKLPPGATKKEVILEEIDKRWNKNKNKLNLLYIGGIGIEPLYNIETLFKTVQKMENITLIVCCRKEDWNNTKGHYKTYLGKNIKIVHNKTQKDLEKYYKWADLCLLCYPVTDYRKIAFPVKLVEYLSYTVPILVTKDSVAANFVVNNKIGIECDSSVKDINNKLNYLCQNRKILKDFHLNEKRILDKNTWNERAKHVADILSN